MSLPEYLDDWVDESNPVRVVDAFVDALDLEKLDFDGIVPEVTGRPSYHSCCIYAVCEFFTAQNEV